MNERADLLDRHDRSCHLTSQPNHERETLNKHLNIVKTNIYLNLSFLCEFSGGSFPALCRRMCGHSHWQVGGKLHYGPVAYLQLK